MVTYFHQIDKEQFEKFNEERNGDNIASAQYLQELANDKLDAKYNLSLLHLGMSLQILSTALDIKQKEIEGLFKLKKDATRDKKMESIIKELNEKINLRYGFDNDIELIPYIYTYNEQGYFMFKKTMFLKLLNGEYQEEISILDNL